MFEQACRPSCAPGRHLMPPPVNVRSVQTLRTPGGVLPPGACAVTPDPALATWASVLSLRGRGSSPFDPRTSDVSWCPPRLPPGAPATRGGPGVAAENRLTGEQLGGLSPGDPVVIEVSGDMRRPRRRSGTIVRIEGSRLVVSTRGVRDGIYIEYYSLRDGLRLGRGATAQLVHDVADAPAASDGRRRQM